MRGLRAEAGLSDEAFRAAVVWMRKRFRLLLREKIADTVCDGEDVDAEIRHRSPPSASPDAFPNGFACSSPWQNPHFAELGLVIGSSELGPVTFFFCRRHHDSARIAEERGRQRGLPKLPNFP